MVKAAFLAGGLALTLTASVFGQGFEDVTVAIDEKSPLGTVGGPATVDSSASKLVIVRTGEAAFVAYSARCTHKGGSVEYDDVKKQLMYPNHESKFDISNGANAGGPANTPLQAYQANGNSRSVKVKIV